MQLKSGFKAIAQDDARGLILGSMPSDASLQQQRYYAHPRNAFWPIMCQLFTLPVGTEYELAARRIEAAGLAVWDVLVSCERPGSLDASIVDSSIEVNNFNAFFDTHPEVRQVFFNGAKAETLYRKHVLPKLHEIHGQISYTRLPSTSPAMASLSLAEKTREWQVVKDYLDSSYERRN